MSWRKIATSISDQSKTSLRPKIRRSYDVFATSLCRLENYCLQCLSLFRISNLYFFMWNTVQWFDQWVLFMRTFWLFKLIFFAEVILRSKLYLRWDPKTGASGETLRCMRFIYISVTLFFFIKWRVSWMQLWVIRNNITLESSTRFVFFKKIWLVLKIWNFSLRVFHEILKY